MDAAVYCTHVHTGSYRLQGEGSSCSTVLPNRRAAIVPQLDMSGQCIHGHDRFCRQVKLGNKVLNKILMRYQMDVLI